MELKPSVMAALAENRKIVDETPRKNGGRENG